MVSAACARSNGKFTADDIHTDLVNEHKQLWLAWADGPQAVCITQIVQFPRRKVVEFIMVTGEARNGWKHFKGEIEDWARGEGCTLSRAIARK